MISFCLIGKNESEILDKCLSALMPYNYEIIFVDTGSSDNTRDIASKYTDKVYDFIWTNDFSAARNFSISKATNEYVLPIDCDEIVTEFDKNKTEALIKDNPDSIGRLIRINEFTRDDDAVDSNELVSRLFSKKIYHYEGTIHEQIVRIDKKESTFYSIPLTMIHSGYEGNISVRRRKTERNREMLLIELAKKPDDTYVLYQLGKTYYMEQEYEQALKYFDKVLGYDVNPKLEYVQNCVEAYGYCLINTKKYDIALGLTEVYREFAVSADFVFLIGLIYMYNGMFDEAIREFVNATHMSYAKVRGTNSYRAYYNIGVIYECIGDGEKAVKYYKLAEGFKPAIERLMEVHMNKVIQLINDDNWEAAAEEILNIMQTETFNDEIAILAATVNEHFGDDEMVFSFIQKGLSYNSQNYELYLMLGNYYACRNVNQSYLCYENALYYCERFGNDEDYDQILQVINEFKNSNDIDVNPYSIIVLSHKDAGRVGVCVESIKNNCYASSYEVIVIDDSDLSIPIRYNMGISRAAKGNDVMLLDSSVVMSPNTIFLMRMELYASDKNGAVGCTLDSYENGLYEYRPWLDSKVLLIKNNIIASGDGLDERYECVDLCDKDFGLHVLDMGYRNILCREGRVSKVCNDCGLVSDEVQSEEAVARDYIKFQEKWGMSPHYYSNVRNDLISMIHMEKDKPIRVLEVGCGIGATLGKIKCLYPNSEVYGIEVVKKVAKLGASNYNIICANIEEDNIPFEEKYFDYIIFGDVIEHLREPEIVLINIRKYLKENGSILVSIPNIMNAETIYQLLHGFFTYEESGIRDKTHLRFFTFYEIVNMMKRVGYEIKEINMSR